MPARDILAFEWSTNLVAANIQHVSTETNQQMNFKFPNATVTSSTTRTAKLSLDNLTGRAALRLLFAGLVLISAVSISTTALADDDTASEPEARKGFHIGPPGKGITFGGGKGLQIGTDNAGVRINGDGIRLGTDKSGVKIDGSKARVGTDEKGLMIGGGEGVRAGTAEQGVKIDGEGARAGSDSSGLVIDGDGVDIRDGDEP